MPGPPSPLAHFDSGYHPPKRQVVKPTLDTGTVDPLSYVHVPIDVIEPFRLYWSAFGTVLPQAITRQKATRKAMLRLSR